MVKGVSALQTHFNVGIFLFRQCVGVPWLVSGFPSEGITLCVAVHSVCLCEEESSGASYVTIFKTAPNFIKS